ncbi:MAG: hypothetical protein CNIPEHKO_00803 [Anaerolineales bacterium]|nr:hypothetical protein [Anaerolineales bacterium]
MGKMGTDFEKETLADFLLAMSSVKMERDYQAEWFDGKLDFYFPDARIAICYLNGQNGDSPTSPKALEQLRKRGVVLHTFTISDVCKQAILDKLPSICDSEKISANEKTIYRIMSRFIKSIMREIRAEEADFSLWTSIEDMKDEDVEEEKRELELETQADIINVEETGEETDGTENPDLFNDELEDEQTELYEIPEAQA